MKCPHCNEAVLVMSERQGVEIDYCQQCRGVWLDRGELDKLIEKSVAAAPPSPPPYQQPGRSAADSGHYQHQPNYGKRKQKSWLSEIFD
jgi:uncharacterized protein